GADGAGFPRDEGDAVPSVLPGERLGEVLPRGIAGARHDLPVRLLDAVVADEIHHPTAALRLHDRQRRLQAPHVAHELELESLDPRLLLEDLEDAAGRRAGVVHQDVETAELSAGAG